MKQVHMKYTCPAIETPQPWWGGGVGGRCPLLKLLLCNPSLKFLYLTNLFVADAPMKKENKKIQVYPISKPFKYGSENRPWVRGLKQFWKFKFKNLILFIKQHHGGEVQAFSTVKFIEIQVQGRWNSEERLKEREKAH